eukprot:gene10019-11744_t
MSTKLSLVSQVSALLGAPCIPEEGLALLELILQKLGEAKPNGLREIKSENAESIVRLPAEHDCKARDIKLPECELSNAQELMAIMEATKQQVVSFLSKAEVEKEALRAHLGVLGTLAARIQRELNTAEAAYVEMQEIMITDRDTIVDLNRRIEAASKSADAEEQILSLQRQLAVRGADFNKLDSHVYSLQFQVNTLTEQIRHLEEKRKKEHVQYRELVNKADRLARTNTSLTSKLAAALTEKTTAELELVREKNNFAEELAARADKEEKRKITDLGRPESRHAYSRRVLSVEGSAAKRPRNDDTPHSSDREEEKAEKRLSRHGISAAGKSGVRDCSPRGHGGPARSSPNQQETDAAKLDAKRFYRRLWSGEDEGKDWGRF